MSRQNKVNKDNYVQAGRLTPDDLARERMKQAQITGRAKSKENVTGNVGSSSGAPEPSRPQSEREEEE
jgi:hypothetical protein